MARIDRRSFVNLALLGWATSLSARSAAAAASHDAWSRLLQKSVTADGWVDYAALRARHLQKLSGYLHALGNVDPESLGTPAEQTAFWLNAYNALCIKLLIDARLPSEVPHSKLFGKNIFTEDAYTIAQKKRSLDDIEHGILRRRFRDPRLHAALVCGASSCPRLRPEAYTAGKLDSQLDEENRRWIRRGKTKSGLRKNFLDRSKKTLYASKIFDWYEEDFGGSAEAVLRFITKYASPSDAAFMRGHAIELEYRDYDWRLNAR